MKPVFHKPMDGKCVQASIASILGLRMDQVPSFNCPGHHYDEAAKEFVCDLEGHSYVTEWTDGSKHRNFRCDNALEQRSRVREFVAQFGFAYSEMTMEYGHREVGTAHHGHHRVLPPGICIAVGESPRFGGSHAVVWDTRLVDFEHPYGRMVHDPYPSPAGERPGIGQVKEFCWLELVDTDLLHNLVRLQSVSHECPAHPDQTILALTERQIKAGFEPKRWHNHPSPCDGAVVPPSLHDPETPLQGQTADRTPLPSLPVPLWLQGPDGLQPP